MKFPAGAAASDPVTPAERIRAQAREATRMALLRAGLAESVERNGRMPSIEALCARAGYTRGAFYLYFRDREHYVTEMLDWVLSDILRSLFVGATEGAGDLQEVVRRFFAALSMGEWPDLDDGIRAAYLAVLFELPRADDVRVRHSELMVGAIERMKVLVETGQRRGTVRNDGDPRQIATFLILGAVGAIVWDGVGIPIDHAALCAATIALLSPPG